MRTGTITLERGVSDSSDSAIMVEACLARLRTTAGLDDEPVLPPLRELLGAPAATTVTMPPARLAPPRAIAPPPLPPHLAPIPTPAHVPTLPPPAPTPRHRLRWPVVVCAFIAGTFGGIAVMKSPVGQRPAVQRVVQSAKMHVAHATSAAKSFIDSRA